MSCIGFLFLDSVFLNVLLVYMNNNMNFVSVEMKPLVSGVG